MSRRCLLDPIWNSSMWFPGVTKFRNFDPNVCLVSVHEIYKKVSRHNLLEAKYKSVTGLIQDFTRLLRFCGIVMALSAPLHP